VGATLPGIAAPARNERAPSASIPGYYRGVPFDKLRAGSAALVLSVRPQLAHYLALSSDREFSNIEPEVLKWGRGSGLSCAPRYVL